MQERLMRARHDKVVAGVCGGLAAYFELDPTIVRLVMLLVAIVGIGVILYPILWLLMPIEPHRPTGQFGATGGGVWVPPASYDPRMQSQQTPVQHPRPYRYDPQTGQPIMQEAEPQAYTGTTVQYSNEAPQPQPFQSPQVPPQRDRRPVVGVLLIAVGAFAVAQELQATWVLALALIVMGAFLLLRNR